MLLFEVLGQLCIAYLTVQSILAYWTARLCSSSSCCIYPMITLEVVLVSLHVLRFLATEKALNCEPIAAVFQLDCSELHPLIEADSDSLEVAVHYKPIHVSLII